MKTTINLSDPLFQKASRIARQEKTTFRALVEEGLRRVLEDRQKAAAFRLRDVSYGTGGLRPEVKEAGWDRVRERLTERARHASRGPPTSRP